MMYFNFFLDSCICITFNGLTDTFFFLLDIKSRQIEKKGQQESWETCDWVERWLCTEVRQDRPSVNKTRELQELRTEKLWTQWGLKLDELVTI